MSFNITGTLISRDNTKQVSDTFKVRGFAIKVEDGSQYENFASFQAVQDRTALLDGLNKGDQIKVHFDLRGREHDGRYFTNLNAWKIEKLDAATTEAPVPAPAAVTPAPEPLADASSDLPF